MRNFSLSLAAGLTAAVFALPVFGSPPPATLANLLANLAVTTGLPTAARSTATIIGTVGVGILAVMFLVRAFSWMRKT